MNSKKKPLIRILGLFLVLSAGMVLFHNRRASIFQEPIRMQDFKLNTVITITVYSPADEAFLLKCMELCDYYEGLFSRTLPSSEIYRLNHGELSTVSPETAELIEIGLNYSRLSSGAFDISIAPVSSLWDFTSGEKKIPSSEELEKALQLVDYRKVHQNGQEVTFEMEGMGLDLGAVAKGYIADRIKEYLESEGVEHALIDLGGNVLCLGGRPDGTPFQIGIQKPFSDRGETIAQCAITDQSLISSGTYERYFALNGRLYHHLLNPATGYPYENGLTSVSIRCSQSVDGDALSTTCFSLGLEKGLALLNSLPDAEGMFVTEDSQVYYSDDFLETSSS